MQRLLVSVPGKQGPEKVREVLVLRSWATASGAALYLFHGTGVYGYLDGSPVKSETDLDIIDNPVQRSAAKKWWQFRGREISEKYYAAKDAAERERIGDFQAEDAAPDTELDYVMYQSRPATGKTKAWGQPFSWIDRFPVRPDWWGQARQIAFKDTEYRVVDDAPEAEEPAPGKLSAGDI